MMRMYDLLAVGLTTLDIAAYPVDALPEPDTGALLSGVTLMPAGTAGGCALVAATLGLQTGLISAVGADTQGDLVRRMLEARGVDTSMLATSETFPTSTTILPVRSDGQRPNLHLMGASVFAGIPAEAWTALPSTRMVHWGGVGLPGLHAEGPNFLAAAKAAGAFVSCDVIAPGEAAQADLVQLLPHVDMFMPSLSEVRYLAETDSLDAAADHFIALGAKGCLFKLGHNGAYLATAIERLHVPAFDIVPKDTTSCGDAFCAGYIAAMVRELPPQDAIRFAAATAALVAQALGTLGRLVDFQSTLSYAAETPLVMEPTA